MREYIAPVGQTQAIGTPVLGPLAARNEVLSYMAVYYYLLPLLSALTDAEMVQEVLSIREMFETLDLQGLTRSTHTFLPSRE